MNEHTEFEKLVKDKFANSFEQPDDLLWKRLNDQLQYNDEKERRRKFIFWWGLSSISVLVIILGTVLYGLNNSVEQIYSINKDKHSSNEFRKNKIAKDQRENNGYKEPINQFNENERSFISRKKNVKSHASDGSGFFGKVRENYSQNSKTDFTLSLIKPNIKGIKNKVYRPEESVPFNKQELPLAIVSNIDNSVDHSTVHPFDENKQNGDLVSVDDDEKGTLESVLSEDMKSEKTVEGTPETLEIENISLNEALTGGNIALRKWFIGVQLIPSYSSRHLTSNSANSSIADFYNSHENGNLTMAFGAFGGLEINKFITLRSGLSYSAYTSTYSVNNLVIAYDTLENDMNIETEYGEYEIQQSEFNDDSEQEDPEEDLTQIDSTTVKLDFSNIQSMKFVQLPIYCDFGFNRNKWKWSVGAGLIYSYLAVAKTEFTTTGYAPIKRNNTTQFNRNSLSGSFNIGVEYALSNQFSVKAAPQFSYMFTHISSENQLTIKPFWIGLDLSIKYYLK